MLAERPGLGDLAQLAEQFGLSPLDVEEMRGRSGRPKLALRTHYASATLGLPVVLARPRRTGVGQLSLIVGGDFVLTVHGGDLRAVVHLMEALRTNGERAAQLMADPPTLAFAITQSLVEASEPSIRRITGAVNALSEDVFADAPPDLVRRAAQLRRDATAMMRALRPDVEVLFAMARTAFIATGELPAHWELLADRMQRLVDDLDEAAATLALVGESQAAVDRHREEGRSRALLLIAATMLALVFGGLLMFTLVLVEARRLALSLAGNNGFAWEWALELVVAPTLVVLVALVGWLRRRGLV